MWHDHLELPSNLNPECPGCAILQQLPLRKNAHVRKTDAGHLDIFSSHHRILISNLPGMLCVTIRRTLADRVQANRIRGL
jgi:hypothetical protein